MISSVSNSVTNHISVSEQEKPKLIKSAHEFEASLMSELLKPLQHDSLFSEDGSDDSSGSGSALADFASESLGKAMSEAGGFGIADQILKHFGVGKNSKTSVQSASNLSDGSTELLKM